MIPSFARLNFIFSLYTFSVKSQGRISDSGRIVHLPGGHKTPKNKVGFDFHAPNDVA